MSDHPAPRGVLRDRLRLGPGFNESVLERSIEERDGADRRLTLECWMAGRRLVSTAASTRLDRALIQGRADMVGQITDATTRQEPRNNRRLRERR